jgi:hypothetical protein
MNALVQIQEKIQSRNEGPEPEDEVAEAVFVQVIFLNHCKRINCEKDKMTDENIHVNTLCIYA